MQNLPCHHEKYMMTVLNLKIARYNCPPLNWDPVKTEFIVGNMVLLTDRALTSALSTKYRVSESVNGYLIKSVMYKIVQQRSDVYL